MTPSAKLAVKYDGPPDMDNDVLGGLLVPGETYECPSRDVYDELIAHPGGWYQPAKTASKEA